jgi:hypothetical protein
MVERWRTELGDKLEVGSAPVHRVLRADLSDIGAYKKGGFPLANKS